MTLRFTTIYINNKIFVTAGVRLENSYVDAEKKEAAAFITTERCK